MKQVLFDSDVLLDILAQRQPFVIASAQALNTVMKKQVQGFVSGHAVTNIFYILRRQIGSEAARKLIENLLQHIQIASITNQVIHQALQSPIKDFEDAVTSAAAMAAGLEIIVTRNKSDFVASLVPAMLPEELLKMLSE
ncbi:MAG: PIN domain-containing protein [Dolichospermum sp. JUN01]|nr:PIN domain-containing protein [Dolichospermum sp. JUN01]MBS9392853.1 PIN domain-containing protein [Dolichospermum sp. OL01]MCO5796488.1 PIN domain-containing protein [Dolichospermum sp. OL03]MCS6282810.1 PIN domain-containing protein [Dolichospermum sp.]QSV58091.1 MAG: PIN domain-containing protein [Dolichospermum sp. LBC05a]QSV62449.1 MAG: PIN domain-containing protein [Dolichospermum sp. DL01]